MLDEGPLLLEMVMLLDEGPLLLEMVMLLDEGTITTGDGDVVG